ncbi:hypothetical protein HUG20_17190 [Salicibibacter cibi]|uniref:Uncharacterized protein n=1 Tax=Salicibibacter cibi TaxID=2743001 RepID=A0A7T6ZDW0_9BACI|nr:hypothetical protein [Salicibibacter cibi]QQK81475.1 hypothetical protein HUG20_17190 [Salicibibacter cibi]
MQTLKKVVPYLAVIVTVTALYNLQQEDTLSKGESQYIDQFFENQQETGDEN